MLQTIQKCNQMLKFNHFPSLIAACLTIVENCLDSFEILLSARENQVEVVSALFLFLTST
jgi:hypothetical protein